MTRCCDSSEPRGANVRGNPCGKWGIIRRLKPVDWTRPQIRCPQKDCKHRFRVNPCTVTDCRDRQHAEEVLQAKRRGL